MSNIILPAILLFFLFLIVLVLYKLAVAVWVGCEILRGKR